jgi:zinc transport system substrate-binding protein
MVFLRFLCLFLLPTVACASPRVVVTLKPIHALVAGVMEGVGSPVLLLPDRASPHTFQLKPSTLKQIKDADLIVWVGPNLETFMTKSVEQASPQYGVLTLGTLKNIKTQPQRQGREWSCSSCSHDHTHDATGNDPHIWLSVDNAIAIVDAVANKLSTVDPLNAHLYQSNAKQSTDKLKALKSSLETELKPVQNLPFLVYHDGYQYFEKEFHLNAKGTMITNPHLPLSAYGLKTIKEQIQSQNIKCVFRETEFNDKLIQQSLKDLSIKIVELDPLGARYPEGPNNYIQTMKGLGKDMIECLKPSEIQPHTNK